MSAPENRVETSEVLTLVSEEHLQRFAAGEHGRLYDVFGAHPGVDAEGTPGVYFAVWAPRAAMVNVIGDFNGWNPHADRLSPLGDSGVWSGFAAGARDGQLYKYEILANNGEVLHKADPFAFQAEVPPHTASRICSVDHDWGDDDWMAGRGSPKAVTAPISIYEVHPGSWKRHDDGSMLGYRELATELVRYVQQTGFTHVELMPVMEHPYYGSWGYQCTGYFAATSRYGSPQDLMFLVDELHRNGIGVILDWVPSHFPTDAHGLARFDGEPLYEAADPRRGYHPDWDSAIFDYGRPEVRSFLLSSALFWLDRYHADGLRVDGVASMLYLDYSRDEGEWLPNVHGGNENLEAESFVRLLNTTAGRRYPEALVIAEESTAWPGVTQLVHEGGLGFDMKWDLGWMHDTLGYFAVDPEERLGSHEKITFRSVYASAENFVLPLSHDEVVHGKGSLLRKMVGDGEFRLANLRLLLGYMWASPGKKLLFMGGEFGQDAEWNHDAQLDWQTLRNDDHQGLQNWVRDLNRCYREWPELHELDCDDNGFDWIDADDTDNSILSFVRRSIGGSSPVVVVANFQDVEHVGYCLGVPSGGSWIEFLNSDHEDYGGGGRCIGTVLQAREVPAHGQPWSIRFTLPPLSIVFFGQDD